MDVRTFTLTQQPIIPSTPSIEDLNSMETVRAWLKSRVNMSSPSENLDSTLCLALLDARRGRQRDHHTNLNEIREMLVILGPIPFEACTTEDIIQFNHYPPQIGRVGLPSISSLPSLYSIADLTFGIAWLYRPESFSSVGIVWCFDDEGYFQTQELLDGLIAQQACLSHPMLLGLLVHQIMGKSIRDWLRMHGQRVIGVQKDTGYHNFAFESREIAATRDDFSIDIASLSAIVGRVSISISTCVLILQALVDLGGFILEENESFLAKTLDITAKSAPTKQQTKELSSLCNYVSQHTKTSLRNSHALLLEAENWAHKATIIVQGLMSLTAQRDAEVSIRIAHDSRALATEAKRDSTSMKAIAAVTMCFLPGTFVAVSQTLIHKRKH